MNPETHDIIIRYISALGFPIVAALALAYALYKIGTYLAQSHIKALEQNTQEMIKQTVELQTINRVLPNICKAQCPDWQACDNYSPMGTRKQPNLGIRKPPATS